MASCIIYGSALALAVALFALLGELAWSPWLAFGSLMAMWAALFALLLGAAWAPFGALICAAMAWRRGLPPRRYAAAGAARSATLVLPWICLVARMSRLPVPKFLWVLEYACAYGIIYALWTFGSILTPLSWWIVFQSSPVSGAYLASALLSFGALVVSVKTARRANTLGERVRPARDGLPHPTYAAQLAYFAVWLAVPFFLFFSPLTRPDPATGETTLIQIVAVGATVAVEALVLAWMVLAFRRAGRKRCPKAHRAGESSRS